MSQYYTTVPCNGGNDTGMHEITYTGMNDTNNNTTLVIVECEEGKMSVYHEEEVSSSKTETISQDKVPEDDHKDGVSEGSIGSEKIDLGELAVIRSFIEVQIKPTLNRSKKNGQTAMMVACLSGSLSVVKHVASSPLVDINKRDSEGNTALMLAAQAGHSDIIRFLLWSYDYIEIDAENSFGMTALMKSALRGHSLCARILIVAGADVEKCDSGRHYRAYDWAIFCGFKKTAKIIKSVGSAGPVHVQRVLSQSDKKQTKIAKAKNLYSDVKRRISHALCGSEENWVDEVGSLYYLVEETAQLGNLVWPISWQKLDRHQSRSDTTESSSSLSTANTDTESAESPVILQAQKNSSKSCTNKNIPLILCTHSSPVEKRKRKGHKKEHPDTNLLSVPVRKGKSSTK